MAIEVRVPDIGDYHDIPVIEILVKPGDQVAAEDPLVTLESDKATMDVPSPGAGTVAAVLVALGDKVSQGSPIITLEGASARAPAPVPSAAGARLAVAVPDIGDYQDIPVIDVLVKVGDTVAAEDALVTLESDKATMDVPSPAAGVVTAILLKVGDKVSQGSLVLELETAGGAAVAPAAAAPPPAPAPPAAAPTPAPAPPSGARTVVAPASAAPVGAAPASAAPAGALAGTAVPAAAAPAAATDISTAHASPSVRRFARELGVDLNLVKGSGPKQRITEEDVKTHVKQTLQVARAASASTGSGSGSVGGLELLPWPTVDFTKFGEVEVKPLSRIKKLSGANLHRNWVRIPHVTNHDEADITDLETLRNELNAENAKSGIKVTALAFLIKAVTVALRRFPEFNASLDGDNLVLKHYFHIGFAADTPNGLVVPVLKNADRKGVLEIAKESSELAAKARDGKLGPADMSGGCFSISSLGGIGGGHFTPIINAPEVAILGVGRSTLKPVWDGQAFVPRLMLPLSLSYDHRVIDGAAAARFNALLARLLADMRRAIL